MGRKPVNAIKGKQGFQKTGPKSPPTLNPAASLPPGPDSSAGAAGADAALAYSAWGKFKARTASAVSRVKEGIKPGGLGKRKRAMAVAAVALSSVGILSACASDADVASQNLSTAAEQFEIERRVVFFNGITDKYLLEINGRCSVETADSALGGSLEVTCKTGPTEYKKHYLGLSDNVSYFVEQVESSDVNVYNYRVVFKPEVIVPDIDLETSTTNTPPPSQGSSGGAPSPVVVVRP